MTKTIEAPPQQRVALPRDCSFYPTDWAVLSRSWFPVARTDEVKDRSPQARLLDPYRKLLKEMGLGSRYIS
jgi:hypothetical protein